MRRDTRQSFAHERRVDELAGFQHDVCAMHRCAAAGRVVVLEPDPALNDERFQPLARTRSRLRLDAEETDAANGSDGHRVTRRYARDENGIAAKNCSGRHQ